MQLPEFRFVLIPSHQTHALQRLDAISSGLGVDLPIREPKGEGHERNVLPRFTYGTFLLGSPRAGALTIRTPHDLQKCFLPPFRFPSKCWFLQRLRDRLGRRGGDLLIQGSAFRIIVIRNQVENSLQGYLAHKKTPTPLGPPKDPRHRPTVGS